MSPFVIMLTANGDSCVYCISQSLFPPSLPPSFHLRMGFSLEAKQGWEGVRTLSAGPYGCHSKDGWKQCFLSPSPMTQAASPHDRSLLFHGYEFLSSLKHNCCCHFRHCPGAVMSTLTAAPSSQQHRECWCAGAHDRVRGPSTPSVCPLRADQLSQAGALCKVP